MKDIQTTLNKTIEKIIKLRIDDIIVKSNLNEKTSIKIKNINENISKEIKIQKTKKVKNKIPKEDRILNEYTLYIKDMSGLIKEKPNLNYLPNSAINKIKSCKDKIAKEQFKTFSSVWNELDIEIKDKYKKLCQNKDLTNNKYNEIVGKSQTPKIARKKKSKESLKNL